jgi:hypothetical protein
MTQQVPSLCLMPNFLSAAACSPSHLCNTSLTSVTISQIIPTKSQNPCCVDLQLHHPAPQQSPQEQQQQQQQQQSAESLYSAWLSRQYDAFMTHLLQLLDTEATEASIQVAAMAAVMECVRHQEGPAVFSNRLFSKLLTVLLTSSNTQPEVSHPTARGESSSASARPAAVAHD